ncbi:protein MODIFIER OF SNC1 1-like [Canna indica]|uniref:Protein MODIFIER OF SNC1 1-like n=1 Tax=Canna indica TaxID=4628 RepID=A0AAQ3L209_9LILI|nr:protein MODIFIER OF SNC1 1-like [Canna indica]
MASNILTGEKRWASARKSGMTILGKVPKPINLPSQRLENNGLDPNVEIVPKGTLTWGSRPSSATQNAWNSSTLLSPKTDGSTGLPSQFGARPSSGGSGTRPSTASSDKSQDPSPNSQGSSSCPATASDLLHSNQTPMASRPRSAETRPGSSQLSRFAENSAEHAVAWGSTRTAEKLGVASSRTDKFSLSSGDFPTLGSEKKSELRSQQGNNTSQSQPALVTKRSNEKEELPLSGDDFLDTGNVSIHSSDRTSYAEGGAPLNSKCQINLQYAHPYQNLNMTPTQFDSWHGSPVHAPDGIWYRGGAIGGPFRPAGAPGTSPVDPCAYYSHTFPPNPEAVPRPGAGLGNYPLTNGEEYHRQVLSNSFMFPNHPTIPARPGPRQAPAHYDGYYSYHQVNLCTSGEQEIHPRGMATGPSVYNQHANPSGSFSSGEFQNSSSGNDSQIARKQMLSDGEHVPHQGHYMILLKQHGGLEENHPQEKRQYGSSSPKHLNVKSKPGASGPKQKGDDRRDETPKLVKLATNHRSPSEPPSDYEGRPSNPVLSNLVDKNSCRTSDGILNREPDAVISVIHDQECYPVMRKNAALIEKIEGLNNKVKLASSLIEVGKLPSGQERPKEQKIANAKPEHSAEVIFSAAAPTENKASSITFMPVPFDENSSNAPMSSTRAITIPCDSSALNVMNSPKLSLASTVVSALSESMAIGLVTPECLKAECSGMPKRIHVTHNRHDYPAKLRSDNQIAVRCSRESCGRDYSYLEKMTSDVSASENHDNYSSIETILTPSLDSINNNAQRGKLKEMIAQHTKQLQKEENRTREQKAKALAKLEELNRRSATQNMKQNPNDALTQINNFHHEENSCVDSPSQTNAMTSDPPGDIHAENAEAFPQASESDSEKHGISVPLSLNSVSNTSTTVPQDFAVFHGPSQLLGHEANTISSEAHVSGGSKHKRMGYRRRQKISLDKNSDEGLIMVGNVGFKHMDDLVQKRSPDENPVTPENKVRQDIPVEVNTLELSNAKLPHGGGSSVHHKKRNNRNSRNRNKDEDSMRSAFTSYNVEEHPCEISKSRSQKSVTETSSVPVQASAGNNIKQDLKAGLVHCVEESSKSEEAYNRTNNQLKPQPPRKPARNQQVRPMDKIHGSETAIWAPIMPSNKFEQSEDSSQSIIAGSNCQSPQRDEQDMYNGNRRKKAEMERYVPKPVAKELQQNCTQKSPYVNRSGEMMPDKPYLDTEGSGMGKFGDSSSGRSVSAIKNGKDNKSMRRGGPNVSWRQRSSSELTLPLESPNESSNSSNYTRLCDKASDQSVQLPEQFEPNSSGIHISSVLRDSVLPSVIKEQGVTSRQTPQQVHTVAGSNYVTPDHHRLQSGIDNRSDVNSPILDLNDADARNSRKVDNKNAGSELRAHSHWKPKSQPCSGKQKQRSGGNSGQKVSSHDDKAEKFTAPGIASSLHDETKSTPRHEDGTCMVKDAGQDSAGTKICVSDSDLLKENQDVLTNTDILSEKKSDRHKNQVTHLLHQHGHSSGRFNRGQDGRYRNRESVHIFSKPNAQIDDDKHKNNTHFEYQPVGSYNKCSNLCQTSSNVDHEAHASRQRFKEQAHSQTRICGHFFRRNSGAAHIADSQ